MANFATCTTGRYANNQTEMDAKLEELFCCYQSFVAVLVVFVVSSVWSKNVDIELLFFLVLFVCCGELL